MSVWDKIKNQWSKLSNKKKFLQSKTAMMPTCCLCMLGSIWGVCTYTVAVPTWLWEAKVPGTKCPLELRDKLAGGMWPALEIRPEGGELIVLGGDEVGATSLEPSGRTEGFEEEPWSWKSDRSFFSKAWMSSMPGDFPWVSPSLSPQWPGAAAGRGVGVEEWPGCTCETERAGSCSPWGGVTVMLLSDCW